MARYDAFGREIGEDTLGEWRTGVDAPAGPATPAPDLLPVDPPVAAAATAPPAERAPVVAGTAVTSPGARHRPGRPRGRRPRVVVWLILLAVLVTVGANVVTFAVDTGQEIRDGIRDVPGLQRPVPEAPVEDPVGLAGRSMIRPGNFRRALAALGERRLGGLQHLRLAPERIDASMLRGGRLRSIQLRHDGGFQRFSVSSPGFGHLDTIAPGRLDPSAPARLVRAAAERMRRPVSRIDYLVPSLSDGVVTWVAYFKGGQYWQGTARGKLLRRIS